MEPEKNYWVEAGLALLVLVGAGYLASRAESGPELAKTTNSIHTLEKLVQKELTQSETKVQTSTASKAAETKVKNKTKHVNTAREVLEVFDPVTGKLSSRKTVITDKSVVASNSAEAKSSSALTAELAQTKTQTVVDVAKSTETKTETTAEYAVDKRSGVSFGLMVSGEGVGPVASINIVSFKPVHLDFVTGMAPAPKVGLGVALEPFPRLAVGVAAAATFTGDPLGYYHPAFPFVGVAPVVTAQYRF
jgi:hypothetical protein